MKVIVVCGYCAESVKETDSALVEINFIDAHIHFLCPKCKKRNKLQLKKPEVALPRSRTMGR